MLNLLLLLPSFGLPPSDAVSDSELLESRGVERKYSLMLAGADKAGDMTGDAVPEDLTEGRLEVGTMGNAAASSSSSSSSASPSAPRSPMPRSSPIFVECSPDPMPRLRLRLSDGVGRDEGARLDLCEREAPLPDERVLVALEIQG